MVNADAARAEMTSDAAQERASRKADGGTFYGPFERTRDIFVRRADSRVVSLLELGSSYTGGVHGSYGSGGTNFDARTGKQLALSDVTTYHNYSGEPDVQQHAIDTLRKYGRPIINTEYMARTRGCTFQKIMPLLRQNNVGALNWGFVAGKTNTIFAWDTPLPGISEPEVWFHDIFRPDHTPFSEEEIAVIKQCNGK